MAPARALALLADAIARTEAADARARFSAACAAKLIAPSDEALDLAALLEVAYPAMARAIAARPEDLLAIARSGKRGENATALGVARDARAYRRLASPLVGDLSDRAAVMRGLRVLAQRERMRIAARELLPNAGSDIDVTARELSELADVCIDVALAEARGWADARYGVPTTSAGTRCAFVVLGMGKLGGRELNAGSDVDLLAFYETDDGVAGTKDTTLHEYFTRVTQRFVETLGEVTEDGFAWRVDMRLRPEGARGALVNSLAAAERYYETWGRTWERAALVRARPVAGDVAFGEQVLAALGPFVWRRVVDPRIADEMIALTARARAELATDPERDLKLGVGGIREVEFFVQSLQLIWGGKEPRVRSTNTLDALRKLRARGLVTDREGRDLADAYMTLRRLEHRVQNGSGLQTHALPPVGDEIVERLARTLGFAASRDLERDLEKTRRRVAARFASLSRASAEAEPPDALDRLFFALDAGDEAAVAAWIPSAFGTQTLGADLARHLLALARRPDYPLGAAARDKHPRLASILVEALRDAADPEQAARLLAAFFARLGSPSAYARALADDPKAANRIVSLFGASAFLGESMVGHPELADRLLFGRGGPTPESSRAAVEEELAALMKPAENGQIPEIDSEDFVGALRRAKGRATIEVGLADLAGELGTRDCTLALSMIADATLDHATTFALRERGCEAGGLSVIAMGKLGGREIGYGSDLDIFFVYDDAKAESDHGERFIRAAQRVLRLVSSPHGDGSGYELDTRLRPSGNQGLLVVSLDAFARYHGVARDGESARAHDWERQALLKARACAGDAALGEKVLAIAHAVAYERPAPSAEAMNVLRARMERELARERRIDEDAPDSRFDVKLGRGGLVDVEFAVQWLQMKYGADRRVRSTDTETALSALEACGYLDGALASSLREGYRLLRRLEQRLRVLHGTGAQLIERSAPGMALLARRMGMRDGPRGTAESALFARYVAVTRDVRASYLAVLGLAREPA